MHNTIVMQVLNTVGNVCGLGNVEKHMQKWSVA